MAVLGNNLGHTQFGAQANNFMSKIWGNADQYQQYNFGEGTYGIPGWTDSPADRRAIVRGYLSNTWKRTWSINRFELK